MSPDRADDALIPEKRRTHSQAHTPPQPAGERLESRKLQSIGGGSTYAVSLPKTWIERSGLAAGDEVMVEARPDGSVVIRPLNGNRPRGRDRELRVEPEDANEVLRTVIGLYVAGFERSTLSYPPASAATAQAGVADACERLHGLQVVEETPSSTVLQDLSNPYDFNMDKGLRRMQLLVLQLLSNAGHIVAGERGTDETLKECRRHETELDRLLILLMKQHNVLLTGNRFGTAIAVTPDESLWYMFSAQFLERTGDYAMRVASSCHFLARDPVSPVTVRVQQALVSARSLIEDASQAFNTRDAQLANAVIARAAAFAPTQGTSDMFDVFTSPRSKPQIYSCERCISFFGVLECVERIGLYAKSIAETAINRATGTPPTRV